MRVNGPIALLAIALVSCGDDSRVAGNGTNIGNAQAAGRILSPGGTPAEGVWIECSPDSLEPWDARLPGWTAVTDSDGQYSCSDLPFGRVGVAAYDPASGLSRWRDDTLSQGRGETRTVDTLAASGKLRVALPPGTNGILHFTGLTRTVSVHGEQDFLIDDMPAGWSGNMLLARSTSTSSTIDSGLRIRPGSTDSAGYTRRVATIVVPLAGGAKAPLVNLPVLVRLDSSWSGFATSLADGSDLRVATSSGKTLPLILVVWDRAARSGSFWTTLDTLPTPGDSVVLRLSWGIPVPATTRAAAFTASRGWIAAWPLGDTGTTATERLGLFPGTISRAQATDGVIAGATRFDGRSSQIVIPNSETSALARPEGGPLTYTCWARLRPNGSSGCLMGRGFYGPSMETRRIGAIDWWIGREYRNSPAGSDYRRMRADSAVWTHLALTVSNSEVALYVNGVRASDSGLDREDVGRKPLPFLIGASIDTLGLTSTASHFSGDLDEAWVQNVARSADWIRFAAANQNPSAPKAKPAR